MIDNRQIFRIVFQRRLCYTEKYRKKSRGQKPMNKQRYHEILVEILIVVLLIVIASFMIHIVTGKSSEETGTGSESTETSVSPEETETLEILEMSETMEKFLLSNPFGQAAERYGEQVLGMEFSELRKTGMYETDQKYYTAEDFAEADETVLKIIKNEIYARHGYIFQNQELYEYFCFMEWYVPSCTPEAFDADSLNEYEQQNLSLLLELGA